MPSNAERIKWRTCTLRRTDALTLRLTAGLWARLDNRIVLDAVGHGPVSQCVCDARTRARACLRQRACACAKCAICHSRRRTPETILAEWLKDAGDKICHQLDRSPLARAHQHHLLPFFRFVSSRTCIGARRAMISASERASERGRELGEGGGERESRHAMI